MAKNNWILGRCKASQINRCTTRGVGGENLFTPTTLTVLHKIQSLYLLVGNVSVAGRPKTSLAYISHTIFPINRNKTYISLFFQIINSPHRKVNFLQVTQVARDRARLQTRCHSQAHTLSATACLPKVTEPLELIHCFGEFMSTDMKGIWVSSILHQPHSGCADINTYLCQVL